MNLHCVAEKKRVVNQAFSCAADRWGWQDEPSTQVWNKEMPLPGFYNEREVSYLFQLIGVVPRSELKERGLY
jgi:hypothetical protein